MTAPAAIRPTPNPAHPTSPQEHRAPKGELKRAIEERWGSLDKFTSQFNTTAAAVQVGRGATRLHAGWLPAVSCGVGRRVRSWPAGSWLG